MRRLPLSLMVAVALLGCSEGATLIQEHEAGGVVTFAYKAERGGPMASRYRADALAIMKDKCPQGYRIVKEGETRGSTTVSGVLEGTEDEVRRRWAYEFRCMP